MRERKNPGIENPDGEHENEVDAEREYEVDDIAADVRQRQYLAREIHFFDDWKGHQHALSRIHERKVEKEIRQVCGQNIRAKALHGISQQVFKDHCHHENREQRIEKGPKEAKDAIFVANAHLSLDHGDQEFAKSPKFLKLVSHSIKLCAQRESYPGWERRQ